MAVTLMTTTGTLEDVQTALGMTPGGETSPSGLLDTTSATVETLPTKEEVPAEAASDASTVPVAEVAPVTDEPVPDSEFDEDGEPTTERAARSSRTKLQTIKKLRVRARDAELRAARAEGELEARRAGIAVPAVQPVAPHSDAEAPKEADYDTYEGYIKATAAHEARLAYRDEQAKHDEAQAAQRQKETQQQVRTAVQQRIVTFKETHPDYEEVIDHPELVLTPAIEYTLTTSDDGPAMAYALGKDIDRFKKIAALPPMEAAIELGMLRAELRAAAKPDKAAPVTPPVKTPTAPPPPTPVRGRAVAASVSLEDFAKTIQPGDASTSEWLRRRNEQLAQRQQR